MWKLALCRGIAWIQALRAFNQGKPLLLHFAAVEAFRAIPDCQLMVLRDIALTGIAPVQSAQF